MTSLVGAPHFAQLGENPVLSFSTYFGGSGFDVVTGVAVDASGSSYITGTTNSPGLATPGAAQSELREGTCGGGVDPYACFDVFIAKFDPTGQMLQYATYLGGSGEDYATGIAVDNSGNAYVTGYSNSVDLPTVSAVQPAHAGGACSAAPSVTPCFDAFVVKVNADGSGFTYVTYLGGSADDFAQGIAVDPEGSVVITGMTASTDFHTHRAMQVEFAGGTYEAFASKLDPSGGRLTFSTYLGGDGDDFGTSLAVDSVGALYLTGYTNSGDLPVIGPMQSAYAGGICGALLSTFPCFDGYIAKLSFDGSTLEYLTYLGGTGADYAHSVAVDNAGSAYVTGMTTSQDLPVTFGAFQTAGGGNNTDAFLAKLGPSGLSLVYSTYLGGIGAESGSGVAVDAEGRAFVTGYGYGNDFPLVNPLQAGNGGFYDAILAVMNNAGTALEFSTYLGGTGHDKARGLAVDAWGGVYIAGETFSSDFPTTRALASAYAGGAFDGFIAKFALGNSPALRISPSEIDFGSQRVGTSSVAQSVVLTNVENDTLLIEAIEVSGDFLQSNDCTALYPGAGCEILITFAPSVGGTRTGMLTIHHKGFGDVAQVPLRGTGLAPTMTLSADSLAFGPQLVGTESPPREITLSNSGNTSLELGGLSVSGEFVQFNDCPSSIEVAGSCTITILFAPATSGERVGVLTVVNSIPEETQTATLTGFGTDFSLSISPNEVTVKAGETARISLSVSPTGGFDQRVSLLCTGAPSEASCSILRCCPNLDFGGAS